MGSYVEGYPGGCSLGDDVGSYIEGYPGGCNMGDGVV